MRALPLAFLALTAAAGCASDTLEQDTAFRRLVDGFDSEQQCLADGDFSICYQTLTLCASGRVSLDLVNRPSVGEYLLDGSTAIAELIDMQLRFDVEDRFSPQLPGRHPWELVEPLVYDCAE